MKKKIVFVIVLIGIVFLSACGKKVGEGDSFRLNKQATMNDVPNINKSTEAEDEESTTEESTVSIEGKAINRLSGEWIEEEIAVRRPIAVMLNNIKEAVPQAGIAQADIVYEILVEGGITRLMGLFQDYTSLEKIGSVRSARHYYVEVAKEYDAIYAHYGQTKYATSKIKELGTDVLSGLSAYGDGVIYYRDNNRKAPHNAYTSEAGIDKGIQILNYRTEYKESYDRHFLFQKEDTDLDTDKSAKKVVLGFSKYTTPWFDYNEEDKTYYRFQYGEKQIDELTQKQLNYKNVLVQFVKEWDIDKNGYQTMDLTGEGTGYYVTNGKAASITWKRENENSITYYYDEAGKEIKLNVGKTWVCIFPSARQSLVTFE